jgi:hypothetical protein
MRGEIFMKRTREIQLIMIVVCGLCFAGTSGACAQQLESKKNAEPEARIELAQIMLRMQMHMDKLHFALQLKNEPLSAFYVHELGEALDEIVEANLKEDNVDLSPLVKTMVTPKLKTLSQNIATANYTLAGSTYLELMESCNSCHQATKHGFIRIIVPKRPALDNQDYGMNAGD